MARSLRAPLQGPKIRLQSDPPPSTRSSTLLTGGVQIQGLARIVKFIVASPAQVGNLSPSCNNSEKIEQHYYNHESASCTGPPGVVAVRTMHRTKCSQEHQAALQK